MAKPQQKSKAASDKKDENKKKVVISPIGRACFVHVFAPFSFEEGKEANFSLMLVFKDKDLEKDPQWAKLKKGCQAALLEKFGEAKLKDLIRRKKLSLPWRPAHEYEDYGPPFEKGYTMISVKSRSAPGIVDERSQPIIEQDDFYPGAYARVSCLPWAFDTKGNQGCTLLLNNVQKAGDGERLAGGRTNAEDEFDPLEEGGDDGDAGDLF